MRENQITLFLTNFEVACFADETDEECIYKNRVRAVKDMLR